MVRWRSMPRDVGGATSIEYGLVAALVAVGCLMSLQAVGQNVSAVIQVVAAGFGGSGPTSGPPPATPSGALGGRGS